MTFKDEIDAAGERYWKSAYEDRVTDILDACVEKIDELEIDLDNVRAATVHTNERMDNMEFATKVHTVGGVIKLSTPTEPQEPFPGYNDLLKESISFVREYIAEKKREQAHKVVPMKRSEN